MPFTTDEVGSSSSTRMLIMLVKAISIQALSPKKFVILDSAGDLHLLHLSNSAIGSDTFHMQQLPHIMKVQKLAILPDVSISTFQFFLLNCLSRYFHLDCFITKAAMNFDVAVI